MAGPTHPPPPGIPGVRADGPLLHTLRSEVARLLSRGENTRFPGAQPVSFASRHLAELQQRDFFVCEKSDGIRCLMYQTEGEPGQEVTYLIDRKNDYYWVQNLHFPLPDSEQNFHTGTIVDGELVNDRDPNAPDGIQLKYLVFDCLTLGHQPLLHRRLDKRLAYYREKVFNPYHSLYEKYPDEKQYAPFVVEFKKMERAYGIQMLFRTILPNLAHGNDGLIFTCVETPYKFGTDPAIMKWKPPEENTIDFLLTVNVPMCEPDSDDEQAGITAPYKDYSAVPELSLHVGGDRGEVIPYGQLFVTPSDWERLKALDKPLDESIVECYQDRQNRWRFMRIREDKHDPNHVNTVESVMESIADRIREEDLIAIEKKIRDAWKAREAEHARNGSVAAPASSAGGAGTDHPNGVNGMHHRDTASGQKRKLGDGGPEDDTENANKRRVTPQPGT